ncbi:response regulator [Ahrensia kielensis]|uniref:Response regulator n=1 Tax=Ahrensia kielensis TaxID=76980 RepID=A0ABU9T7D9_9HYPH
MSNFAIDFSPELIAAKRVLLVEDSSVTQDLIQLVLSQGGHSVDIFSEGKAALEALKTNKYDVALVDYHLPDMTGIELVTQYTQKVSDGARPYFVAITGDMKSLLRDRTVTTVFDRLMPKPLDIDAVCTLVETAEVDEAKKSNADDTSRVELTQIPDFLIATLESLNMRFLRWPEDLRSSASVKVDDYDALLVTDASSFSQVWTVPGAHLLPVIDATGSLGSCADIDGTALRMSDVKRVSDIVQSFFERRMQMYSDVAQSSDFADKLLGRMWVTGKTLTPVYSGADKSLVDFPVPIETRELMGLIKQISANAHLSPTFFDRFHECAQCLSSRFNAREECPSCQSTQLNDESYIHHFQCAYQGPESDFTQGQDLVCPKCRHTLKHFGRDYDRPGQMVVCGDCKSATSEPFVGFVCCDCSHRTDGDTIETVDVFSATLTEAGERYLRAGTTQIGISEKALRFADLPLELVIYLNKLARAYNEHKVPFSLCYITYKNEASVITEHGTRHVSQARRVFFEALGQAISIDKKTFRGSTYDFVLVGNLEPDKAKLLLEEASRFAEGAIKIDLAPEYQLFGPADFSA